MGAIESDAVPAAEAGSVLSFDHVAVAVRDIEAALVLFRDVLGGRFVMGGDDPVYGIRTVQFELPPGTKVELMAPLREETELTSFLAERGEGFHHATFLVDDLEATIAALEERGFEVVDTDTSNPAWEVTYVRPRSSFGTLLQIARSTLRWDEPVPGVTLEAVLAGEVVWYDERPTLRSELPDDVTIDI